MRKAMITLAGAAALAAGALGNGALATQAPAPAQPPVPPEVQVDVTACQACHGPDGISTNPRVPNLAGQQPEYIVAQLQAFKAGTRRSDLMEAVAAQLSEAEMNALARYWHGRPAGGRDGHAAASAPSIPSRMTFPAGFPNGFRLYQTVSAEGSVTERYANAAAFAAAREGRPLPDGSVIIGVNRPAPGAAPTGYAAMEARAGWGAAIPALLRNGNWDFALFDAQGVRNDRLNQAPCLGCHRPHAATSHIFTLAELRAAAARPAG